MKGDLEFQRRARRKVTRTELALSTIIICLLIQLYYPVHELLLEHVKQDKKIFICHTPEPSLLNRHEIDRSAFDPDIDWVRDLLEGVVQGNNGYGNAADSVTLSIFLPNGEPIFEEGFGRVKANESETSAPDGDSIYRMASITKMFTAAQLILQKQRGQVDLEQDVSTILDDFHPSTKGWTSSSGGNRVITTKQLLSHTSGLFRDEEPIDLPFPNVPDDPNNIQLDHPTRAEMMKHIRDTPAVMAVSTIPSYSNIGFTIAGFVAEKVGQTDYVKLLQRDLFDPLNMTSASFKAQLDKLDRVVVPSEPHSRWAFEDVGETNPSGGMFCSAADLRRFGQELLGPGKEAQGSASIFDKTTTREWLRPVHVFDDNLLSVGLSWEIFTVPVGNRKMTLYSKGGTLAGFHTLFGVDKDREFGYSLLISGEPKSNTELGIRIMRRFAATLDIQRQNILKKGFAGTYTGNDSDLIKLELVDGGLAMTQAVIDGLDLFKTQRLGEDEGNFVGLWPTGEPNAWRLAIGRPPAQPYVGCMYKFASIDPALSRGFPVDLVTMENGKLFYGAVNQTFTRH